MYSAQGTVLPTPEREYTKGMTIRKDDRVTGDNGKWTATVLEIRDTPDGQSAKVRRDDRKAASWYWVSQLTAGVQS